MKKIKLALIALTIASVVMGAGYAAWTDQLTVSTTVNTGELKVDFHPYVNVAYANDWGTAWDGGYITQATTALSEDAKSLTIGLDNVYPGAQFYCYARAINNGTIPATFNGAVVTVDEESDPDLLNAMRISYIDLWITDVDGNYIYSVGNYTDISIPELQNVLDSYVGQLRLEPGQGVTFSGAPNGAEPGFVIGLPADAENNTMKKMVKFDMQFNWIQSVTPEPMV